MKGLNEKVAKKGYRITKRTSNCYELRIDTIKTGVATAYAVHTAKTLKDMETFINKKILPLNDIVQGAKYTASYGILKVVE